MTQSRVTWISYPAGQSPLAHSEDSYQMAPFPTRDQRCTTPPGNLVDAEFEQEPVSWFGILVKHWVGLLLLPAAEGTYVEEPRTQELRRVNALQCAYFSSHQIFPAQYRYLRRYSGSDEVTSF